MVIIDFEPVIHGGVNIEVEGNSPMEEDDPKVENTIEDVGIGVVDNVPENIIEEDVTSTIYKDDEICGSNDDGDNLDMPIIEKAYEPLYQNYQATLLFALLLLENFKVMNGISNVAMSCMLRYSVIFIIFYVRVPIMFFILKIFFHRLIFECLLPPSNILPHSYKELSTIMKDIGMEYQIIHKCPNDHIIYHKKHEFATKFS